jgi:hypothetical protein
VSTYFHTPFAGVAKYRLHHDGRSFAGEAAGFLALVSNALTALERCSVGVDFTARAARSAFLIFDNNNLKTQWRKFCRHNCAAAVVLVHFGFAIGGICVLPGLGSAGVAENLKVSFGERGLFFKVLGLFLIVLSFHSLVLLPPVINQRRLFFAEAYMSPRRPALIPHAPRSPPRFLASPYGSLKPFFGSCAASPFSVVQSRI